MLIVVVKLNLKTQSGQVPIIIIFRLIFALIGLFLLIQGLDGLGDIAQRAEISQWTTNFIKSIFGFGLIVLGISPRSLVMIFRVRG